MTCDLYITYALRFRLTKYTTEHEFLADRLH